MSCISKCFQNLVPTNAVRTHNLMNQTANMSKNSSCTKVYFVAKTNAIALIVMSALNTLTFPVVGLLDFVSSVIKLDKKAFAILGTSLLDTLKSIASVIVIAVALVISFVCPRIFKNPYFKQNDIPKTELAIANADRANLQQLAADELSRATQLSEDLTKARDVLRKAQEAESKANASVEGLSSHLRINRRLLTEAEDLISAEPARLHAAVQEATEKLEKTLRDRFEKASSEITTLLEKNQELTVTLGSQKKEYDDTVNTLNTTINTQKKNIHRHEATIKDLKGRDLKGKQNSLNQRIRDNMIAVFNAIVSEANALKPIDEQTVAFKKSVTLKAASILNPSSPTAATVSSLSDTSIPNSHQLTEAPSTSGGPALPEKPASSSASNSSLDIVSETPVSATETPSEALTLSGGSAD